MSNGRIGIAVLLGIGLAGACGLGLAAEESVVIEPPAAELHGDFERVQFLAARSDSAGQLGVGSADLTHEAEWTSADPGVAQIVGPGVVQAMGNGETEIRIHWQGRSAVATVKVTGVQAQPRVEFSRWVAPLLSKAGCNMGACHAAQHGKGGFKLSVFGFEPDADRSAMVRDRGGRRVDLLDVERSLLLQKPAMHVAHGGGLRLPADSPGYAILAAWLRCGAPGPAPDDIPVAAIRVLPAERLGEAGMTQQLRVEATYADGRVRDVTALATFESMDDGVLAVTDKGRVTAVGRGRAPVLARFAGQAQIASFTIPFAPRALLADWTSHNVIDELAAEKFRELGIEPSPICDDTTFLRRAFLDCIGTLPTPEETAAFMADTRPDKRAHWVDRLLGLTGDPQLDVYNEAYSAYWTLKWSDLIRNTSKTLGEQGMWALHNWIRQSFRENKPFDVFVRELVTGKGSIYSDGPANYFRINTSVTDLTEATSQLFLGIRLECAKCHHHPFESIGQEDYYGFAAFFARVGTKNSEEFGLFGREQIVVVRPTGEVKHPKTNQNMLPTPLGGEPVEHPLDRRIALADWLTSPDNTYFAQSVVNRYMYYLLGRGLVDPVDDLRSTNPPSNPAMMNALAAELVKSQFDLKQLVRTIMTSRLYQLSSQPTPENASDDRYYSHFRVKRLPAEVLLDAIDQVTSVPTKFRNLPAGTRAIELPDAEYPNYFLNTFAKPRRASVCECERSGDESLSQALHTLNGDTLAVKIADKKGRLNQLLSGERPVEEVVSALYLAALCRPPSDPEMETAKRLLEENDNAPELYEDLFWALLNSKQFLFVY